MGERRDRKQRIGALRRIPLLASCSDRELIEVDRLGAMLDVEAGSVLVDEGEKGAEAFLVVDGTATVQRAGRPIGVAGPGAVVGEMALLDGSPRTATVVATTRMRVLVLDVREFGALARVSPSVGAALHHLAEERRAATPILH